MPNQRKAITQLGNVTLALTDLPETKIAVHTENAPLAFKESLLDVHLLFLQLIPGYRGYWTDDPHPPYRKGDYVFLPLPALGVHMYVNELDGLNFDPTLPNVVWAQLWPHGGGGGGGGGGAGNIGFAGIVPTVGGASPLGIKLGNYVFVSADGSWWMCKSNTAGSGSLAVTSQFFDQIFPAGGGGGGGGAWNWMGVFNGFVTYNLNDVVSYQGSSYIWINPVSGVSSAPDQTPGNWALVASKGADGTNGNDGSNGTQGTDGVGITGAAINGNGNLTISLTTGSTIDVGHVVGTDGQSGSNGTNGTDGVSINGANIDNAGKLIISLTNGTTFDAGSVIGPKGDPGEPGITTLTVGMTCSGNGILKASGGTLSFVSGTSTTNDLLASDGTTHVGVTVEDGLVTNLS